jgi:cysteine-rich repeat protein
MRDPQGILDDVTGPLRLLVLDASTHSCNTATGVLEPDPADGPVDASVVDIAFEVASGAEVRVARGRYAVLVRGRGEDPVSGRTDQVIATGCTTEEIGAGQTKDVTIEMHQIVGQGVCGDSILSPDEQCEDGNTAAADGCDPECRSEPFRVNSTTEGVQTIPAAGWTGGARAAVAYDSDKGSQGVRLMYLSEGGQIIGSPTALALDLDIDAAAGIQTETAVAVGGGRVCAAFSDFRAGSDSGDVRVRFFSQGNERTPDPPFPPGSVLGTADRSGAQTLPSIAARADGSALVVFQDSTVPTGLRGRLFPAGGSTPDGADAFVVGIGVTAGREPSVAAFGDGFVVAFCANDDVFFQRVGADGSAVDPNARAALEGTDAMGTQDQARVAALPDGRFLLSWRDAGPSGDGVGTSIRARAFDAEGEPVGPASTVNTTVAGDQGAVTVAAARERFVVAWSDGTGEARARVLGSDGSPALNREPDPTTDDFVVASRGTSPAVAAGGDGLWLLVYEDVDGNIGGRTFPLP